MSRNLGDTWCKFCGGKPVLDEPARVAGDDQFGYYASEYRGMKVANATCPDCKGKYLAWVEDAPGKPYWRSAPARGHEYMDLSFRRAFNDEPAPEDLYEIHPNIARANRLRREADELMADLGPTGWEIYRDLGRS